MVKVGNCVPKWQEEVSLVDAPSSLIACGNPHSFIYMNPCSFNASMNPSLIASQSFLV